MMWVDGCSWRLWGQHPSSFLSGLQGSVLTLMEGIPSDLNNCEPKD